MSLAKTQNKVKTNIKMVETMSSLIANQELTADIMMQALMF